MQTFLRKIEGLKKSIIRLISVMKSVKKEMLKSVENYILDRFESLRYIFTIVILSRNNSIFLFKTGIRYRYILFSSVLLYISVFKILYKKSFF